MIIGDERWDAVRQLPFKWTDALVAKLRGLDFPVLDGPTLTIYSDYSGSSRGSRFETICILVIDSARAGLWDAMRSEARRAFLSDGRRMSFKGLNDNQKRRALPAFLAAANQLQGVCCVIAIDKRVGWMCAPDDASSVMKSRGILSSSWRPKSFEQMMRVVSFVSLFTGMFSQPYQNIYWISDEDELFANPSKTVDTKALLERMSSVCVRHPLGELGLGTTTIDEDDRFDEDCAAIPDLVAGATAEVLTGLIREGDALPDVQPLLPTTTSRKGGNVIDWFFGPTAPLRKFGILFGRKGPGHYQVGTWKVEDSLIEHPPSLWIRSPSESRFAGS
jgi:hypothetical protein